MKYRLNQLPIKTTNGFKINDVELDLTLPKFQMSHDFVFEGDISSIHICQTMNHLSEDSRIGLEYDTFYDIQIEIPKNICVKGPIIVHYFFEKDDALFSKFTFSYEENSSCDFIILMESSDETNHFNHLVERVTSKESSKGNITYVNLLNSKSTSFYALENDVLEHASITHTIIDLGGKTRLYNVHSNLKEKDAFNSLNTIYIGKKDELLDFNYYLNNIGCGTNNYMKVEGVLDDSCQKNFRGTIDFIKGCTHSIGEENENCILLSDTCRSRSLPQMLCGEENVVGTHGVSSGKVDENKLFYLMSRGYAKKEAEKFIVLSNFMSILNNVSCEEMREKLLNKIEDLLS